MQVSILVILDLRIKRSFNVREDREAVWFQSLLYWIYELKENHRVWDGDGDGSFNPCYIGFTN